MKGAQMELAGGGVNEATGGDVDLMSGLVVFGSGVVRSGLCQWWILKTLDLS